MYSHLALLLVLGLSFGCGYVLVESGSIPKSSSGEKNPEDIRKPLQDVESLGDDSVDEEEERMMKDFENRFTAAFIRMIEGDDDLYKDARFDAIIKALKSSMLSTTGEVDEDYIRKLIETYRKQDAAKRKQIDEVNLNKLGFSSSDFRDFLEVVSQDMKRPAARSPRASESNISK